MPRSGLRHRTPTTRDRIALLTEARNLVRRSQNIVGVIDEETLIDLQREIERAVRRLRRSRVMETRRNDHVGEIRNRDIGQTAARENQNRENGQAGRGVFMLRSAFSLGNIEGITLVNDDLNNRTEEVMINDTVEDSIEPSSSVTGIAAFDDAGGVLVISNLNQDIQIHGSEDAWMPTDTETEALLNAPDDPEREPEVGEVSDGGISAIFEILPDAPTTHLPTLRRENASMNSRWSGLRPVIADTSETTTMLTLAGFGDTYIFSLERRDILRRRLITDMARYATQREAYLEGEYGFSNYQQEAEQEPDGGRRRRSAAPLPLRVDELRFPGPPYLHRPRRIRSKDIRATPQDTPLSRAS